MNTYRNTDEVAMDAAFLNLYQNAPAVVYCTIAAFTWVLYDYFLTFQDEVNYVWMRPWGFAKILFLWMRYFGVMMLTVAMLANVTGNHDTSLCFAYLTWEGSAGAVLLYTVEVILQLRLYAIFNRNKKLAILNGTLFLMEIVVMLVVFNVGMKESHVIITPVGLTGCFTDGTIPYLFATFLPALIFESWLAFLALYKAYARAKGEGVSANDTRVDFLTILIRDNIIYFVLIAVALLINTLIWALGVASLATAAVPVSHASMYISGTRLLLNLRRVYYDRNSAITTSSAGVHTDVHIRFEGRPPKSYEWRYRIQRTAWDVDTALLTAPDPRDMATPEGLQATMLGMTCQIGEDEQVEAFQFDDLIVVSQ